MPASARGSVYPVRGGFGIRWTEQGRREHKSAFRTKTEARDWFNVNVAPRLRRAAPSADITLDAFIDLFLERHRAQASARTVATLRERLAHARKVFGTWKLSELEGAADDIARWRAGLTDTSRYRLTLALRQALAAELGPVFGPLCIFAAETGLRTNEWTGAERRDVDRTAKRPAFVVQRRYADGVLTPYPKTDRRRVPLTERALEALAMLPPMLGTKILFPAAMGGHIGLDTWRTREWYPALEAAGVEQRGPYHLRHTFATEALAGGMSIFQLSRVMGASVKTIDRTYGHLAHDSEDSILGLLNARGRYIDQSEETL